MKIPNTLYIISIIAICFSIFILYIINYKITYISYLPAQIEYDSTYINTFDSECDIIYNNPSIQQKEIYFGICHLDSTQIKKIIIEESIYFLIKENLNIHITKILKSKMNENVYIIFTNESLYIKKSETILFPIKKVFEISALISK